MADADHTINPAINSGSRTLPKGVIVRKRISGNYYYYQTSSAKGRKRREYPLGRNKAAALLAWRAISSEKEYQKPVVCLRKWVGEELLVKIKTGAKRRSIHFDISIEEINKLVDKSKGKCSLTGIPFDLSKDPKYRLRLWAPSIDRIDSSKGYTADNIRLVVASVNIALSDFGEDVLIRIAKGIAKVKYGKHI